MYPSTLEPGPHQVVLGLGNVLMGDDAFGPHVIRRIQAAYGFGPQALLIDAGTPGFDIASLIVGSSALIAVDTVIAEGAPGELRLYRRDEILARPLSSRANAHGSWLREALLTLQLLGSGPASTLLIGVIPSTVAPRTQLSPAVRGALWRAEVEVIREMIRLGQRPRLIWPPRQPDIWWERRYATERPPARDR